MPNLNNEGIAFAPQSSCVAGRKEVVWSDDGDTDGHSLRSGTVPCEVLPTTRRRPTDPTPTPVPTPTTPTPRSRVPSRPRLVKQPAEVSVSKKKVRGHRR